MDSDNSAQDGSYSPLSDSTEATGRFSITSFDKAEEDQGLLPSSGFKDNPSRPCPTGYHLVPDDVIEEIPLRCRQSLSCESTRNHTDGVFLGALDKAGETEGGLETEHATPTTSAHPRGLLIDNRQRSSSTGRIKLPTVVTTARASDKYPAFSDASESAVSSMSILRGSVDCAEDSWKTSIWREMFESGQDDDSRKVSCQSRLGTLGKRKYQGHTESAEMDDHQDRGRQQDAISDRNPCSDDDCDRHIGRHGLHCMDLIEQYDQCEVDQKQGGMPVLDEDKDCQKSNRSRSFHKGRCDDVQSESSTDTLTYDGVPSTMNNVGYEKVKPCEKRTASTRSLAESKTFHVIKRCKLHEQDYVTVLPSGLLLPQRCAATVATLQPPGVWGKCNKSTMSQDMTKGTAVSRRRSTSTVLEGEDEKFVPESTKNQSLCSGSADNKGTCSREMLVVPMSSMSSESSRSDDSRRLTSSSASLILSPSQEFRTTQPRETTYSLGVSDCLSSEEPELNVETVKKQSRTKTDDNIGDVPSKKSKSRASKLGGATFFERRGKYGKVQHLLYYANHQKGDSATPKVSLDKNRSAVSTNPAGRKFVSLGSTSPTVRSEEYADAVWAHSVTTLFERPRSVTVSKPPATRGSCPFPTFTFPEDNVDDNAAVQDRIPVSSLALLHDKPGDSQSPLEPSVAQGEHWLAIASYCRAYAVPMFVLMSVLLIVGSTTALLPKSLELQEPGFEDVQTNHTTVMNNSATTTGSGSLVRNSGDCHSVPCQRDATYFKGLISWDHDPCDNFYRFICDQWRSKTLGATPRDGGSVHSDMTHLLESQIMHLLQRPNLPQELSMAKAIFQECANAHYGDDWSPTLDLLRMVSLGGFPYARALKSTTSFWEVAGKLLRHTGTETLLSISTVHHPSQANRTIIAVDVPEPLSPRPYDPIKTTEFYNSTAYAAITVIKKQRQFSSIPSDVASFAANLEALGSHRAPLYSPVEANTMNYPEIMILLSEIFSAESHPIYAGMHTTVLILCPDYFQDLLSLVNNTDQRTILNYLGVRLLVEMSAFFPHGGRLLQHALVERLYGRPRPFIPRWKLCVRVVERAIPLPFLYAVQLVRDTNRTSIQNHVRAVVYHLERSFDDLLLLDEHSKGEACRLLNETRISLFRPTWVADRRKLATYIDTIPKVIKGQGLRSFYSLRSHSFHRALKETPEDRWLGSAFDDDCRADDNTVYVPTLMFNLTVIKTNALLLLPYAGTRIARCLLRVALRVVQVNRTQGQHSRWWPDLGHSFFGSSLTCFDRHRREGTDALRLLESTAAVKSVFELFLSGRKDFTRFSALPEYEMDKLFFVYYAHGFCHEYKSANNVASALLVNAPLWSNRAFQETFRCGIGTKMNPSKKCPLWRSTSGASRGIVP